MDFEDFTGEWVRWEISMNTYPYKPAQDSVIHPNCPTSDYYTKPAQTPEITIKYTFKPTHNLFTYSDG